LPISFALKQVHDPIAQVLDIDIDQESSVVVPRGTYRLATKDGLTSKYVTFVIDGRISRYVNESIHFEYKIFDGTYDEVSIVSLKRFNNTEIDFEIDVNINVDEESDR
jgi:hypothetical protein